MKLTNSEVALIVSALESDKVGGWASDRSERIAQLLRKIKGERE